MAPKVLLLVAVAFTVGRSITASAQVTDPDQFNKFLASDLNKTLVERAVAALPPTIYQQCPGLVAKGSKATVFKPMLFSADGIPTAGVWREAFPVSGCGNDTILNLFFSTDSEGKITTVVGDPGTTHTDPRLQEDALTYVNTSTAIVAKDCSSFDVRNTRFEAYGQKDKPMPDPAPGQRLPWWETWEVTGCGRTFEVPVSFTPESDGGTDIAVPTRGIVER